MNNEQKLSVFGAYLDVFKIPEIKEIVNEVIINTPILYFGASTSSTGKYHPSATNGIMGLVKHSVAVMLIAQDSFRNDVIMSTFGLNNLSDLDKEIILAACLLHDNAKYGAEDDMVYVNEKIYTNNEHPRLVSEIAKKAGLFNSENKDLVLYLGKILDLIETHMGQWTNVENRYNKNVVANPEPLDAPKTGKQRFVHLCDYMASRKTMDVVSSLSLPEDLDNKTLEWFNFQNS